MGKIRDIGEYIAGMCGVVFATRKELENNLYMGHHRESNPMRKDYERIVSQRKIISFLREVIPDKVYFRRKKTEKKDDNSKPFYK